DFDRGQRQAADARDRAWRRLRFGELAPPALRAGRRDFGGSVDGEVAGVRDCAALQKYPGEPDYPDHRRRRPDPGEALHGGEEVKKFLLGAAVCGLAGGAVLCADLAVSGKWFEDVTVSAGVNHPHSNRSFKNPYANIMEGYTALGASAAVADYDGDGFDDVFVTDSKLGGKNHLYHNNHNFTFTDKGDEAGVSGGNDESNATSDSLWFDYNNDGKPDLLVLRFGHNTLYKNLGNGKFEDVTKQAGLYRYSNAITAIAFDYDRDGQLDLFVGSYFQPINIFNPDSPRFFPESFETANNGGGVTVFRNKGNGTFEDVTKKVGLSLSGWTLDLGNGDADNDGFDDLYIACDFGTDRFFHNNGNGTFTDITEKAIGIDSKKGMNVDWGDYDNDGLLD